MFQIDACTYLFMLPTLLKMPKMYQGLAYANMPPRNKLRYGYGLSGG